MASLIVRHQIWRNDTGVTLSNAGNLFLEAGGLARTYWVPKGDWTGLGGTRVTGETDTNQPNNTVDTFRGGPALRREHLFPIDLADLARDGMGFDKMFVEWRGEVVGDSTGFAIGGAPGNNYPRTYWGSSGQCWAAGTFVNNASPAYLSEPPVVCYKGTEAGKNSSTMAGANSGTATEPFAIVGGFMLTARSFGDPSLASADVRQLYPQTSRQQLPHILGFGNALTKAGLLWGYTATDGGGANISRYPKNQDRFGWVYQVGYPSGPSSFHQGGITTAGNPIISPLSVTGLAKVWLAIYENAPQVNATPEFLSFTNASMVVRGAVHVILIRE